MLHLIMPTTAVDPLIGQVLQACKSGDAVVLMNAAINYAAELSPMYSPLTGRGCQVYALEEDLQLHGIQCGPGIAAINYDKFVDLSVLHSNTTSWY